MRNIFEGTAVTPKDREKILTNIITIVQEIDHDTGTNKNGVLDIIVQNSDLNSALLKMFVKKIYPGVEIVWAFLKEGLSFSLFLNYKSKKLIYLGLVFSTSLS